MIEDVVVALTDYGLPSSAPCSPASCGGRDVSPGPSRLGFAVFFGATAIAALAGGTFHGFLPDDQRLAGALLWRVTLLAIGLGATAA